jgi:hypothetical protein
MGCPNEVVLENNLVFSVCTHDPDTGVLTDADAAPDYRLYEDETATPILTGIMAKLDDANTTGFYTELVACSAENGFEVGKSYTIYVAATVDSDTGGISYGFTVKPDPWTATEKSQIRHRLGIDGEAAAPSASPSLVTEIFAYVVEGSETFIKLCRYIMAFVGNLTTGSGTANVTFRDRANTKARIDATILAGNRTDVTLDGD